MAFKSRKSRSKKRQKPCFEILPRKDSRKSIKSTRTAFFTSKTKFEKKKRTGTKLSQAQNAFDYGR